MVLLNDTNDLDTAWVRLRFGLARWTAGLLPTGPCSILEVGCGHGQLTVPLAEVLPEASITAIDLFHGVYSHDYAKLNSRLERAGLADRVRVIRGNALRWITTRRKTTFDVVLSSEFLPELTQRGMGQFFRG